MEVKRIVEQRMLQDDEITAYQLYYMLKEKGLTISIWTIFCSRRELGWTFRGRHTNKEKQFQWANIDEAEDGFEDVIFTDESSVQLESHKRYCH